MDYRSTCGGCEFKASLASTETNICSVINKVFSGRLMGLGGVFGNWKGYMYLGTKGKWLGFWLV